MEGLSKRPNPAVSTNWFSFCLIKHIHARSSMVVISSSSVPLRMTELRSVFFPRLSSSDSLANGSAQGIADLDYGNWSGPSLFCSFGN